MWALLGASALRWMLGGAVVIAAIGGLYIKGRSDGNIACVAKQQSQMAKMEKYVRSIRDKIERNQPIGDDILRSDPFERPEN